MVDAGRGVEASRVDDLVLERGIGPGDTVLDLFPGISSPRGREDAETALGRIGQIDGGEGISERHHVVVIEPRRRFVPRGRITQRPSKKLLLRALHMGSFEVDACPGRSTRSTT